MLLTGMERRLLEHVCIFFGGVNSHRFLNDLHVLHVPTRTWSCLEIRGAAVPSPRMRPALVPVAPRDAAGPPLGDDGDSADAPPTFLLFGGTRAWGAAAAVATATARHDGDLFAITLQPARLVIAL